MSSLVDRPAAEMKRVMREIAVQNTGHRQLECMWEGGTRSWEYECCMVAYRPDLLKNFDKRKLRYERAMMEMKPAKRSRYNSSSGYSSNDNTCQPPHFLAHGYFIITRLQAGDSVYYDFILTCPADIEEKGLPFTHSFFGDCIMASAVVEYGEGGEQAADGQEWEWVYYEDGDDFEVEQILREVIDDDGSRMFYVKWLGYGHEQNQYVKEAEMACDELIEEWDKEMAEKRRALKENKAAVAAAAAAEEGTAQLGCL